MRLRVLRYMGDWFVGRVTGKLVPYRTPNYNTEDTDWLPIARPFPNSADVKAVMDALRKELTK